MIGIASDHGGYQLKKEIIDFLQEQGYAYQDFGCYSEEAVDYPDYVREVTNRILTGECERGIILCGTGIGASITANRIPGIRAALCHDVFSARATRQHNDANILALGGRTTGPEVAKEMVAVFLTTEFSGDERHCRRIRKIEEAE